MNDGRYFPVVARYEDHGSTLRTKYWANGGILMTKILGSCWRMKMISQAPCHFYTRNKHWPVIGDLKNAEPKICRQKYHDAKKLPTKCSNWGRSRMNAATLKPRVNSDIFRCNRFFDLSDWPTKKARPFFLLRRIQLLRLLVRTRSADLHKRLRNGGVLMVNSIK